MDSATAMHLAIDLQHRFLPPQSSKLLDDCRLAISSFSARGLPTIWATTGDNADWGRLSPRRRKQLCSEVPEQLWPVLRGQHAVKTGDSVFGNPALLPYLRRHGVVRLYISGVYLSHCVQATVWGAVAAGLDCVVPAALVRDHGADDDAVARYRRMREIFGHHEQVTLLPECQGHYTLRPLPQLFRTAQPWHRLVREFHTLNNAIFA